MSVLKIKTKLSNQKALKIILVFGRKTSRKNRMIKAKRCKTKMILSKIAQLLKTIKEHYFVIHSVNILFKLF